MATKKKRAPTNFVRSRFESTKNTAFDDNKVKTINPTSRDPYEKSPFVVVFPAVMHGSKPFVLDLQFLMPLTNIGRAFFEGHLKKLGPRPRPHVAVSYTKKLRLGFVKFLTSEGLHEVNFYDLCSSIIPKFEKWLNQKKDEKAVWRESTRVSRYLYVRTIFENIINIERWKSSIPNRPRFKSNPWPLHSKSSKKKEVVDDDLATRIRVSSIRDIVDTIHRRGEIQRIIEENVEESNPKKNDGYHTLRRDYEYEKVVLHIYRELLINPRVEYSHFSKYKYTLKKYNTTINEIRDLIFPSPRLLVPFVILMSLALSYNASTILNARLGDFSTVNEFSSYLVYFNTPSDFSNENSETEFLANAFKPRSHSRQPVYIPIDGAPDNPHFIYGYIRDWTANLRRFAYTGISDKLFIFCTTRSAHGISSFTGLDGTASAQGWAQSLSRFRQQYDLEHFTLDMLRPTSLDVTFEEFNGDIRLASIQGNHKHIDTTSRSYRSDAEKKRQYERLGAVHRQRERWRKSEGKIDPRDHPVGFDIDCATPGWTCADSNDSPFAEKGSLCDAYGRCPACPLGSVNLNSPLSCAYTLALLEAIDDAQQSLDPRTWLERWLPVKQKLVKKWIPSFSQRAMREASKIDIPTLPRPE